MSDEDRLPWETNGDLPWEKTDAAWEPGDPEAWRSEQQTPEEPEQWRAEQHRPEWPEHLAGPEYWLFKSQGGTSNG